MQKIIIFSLLLPLLSYSQNKEAIKEDSTIIWAAEVSIDYALDYDSYYSDKATNDDYKKIGIQGPNRFKLLKTQVQYPDNSSRATHQLFTILANKVNGSNIKVYHDDALQLEMSEQERYRQLALLIDTSITFDPETSEEIIQVNITKLKAEDIIGFRVKQFLCFGESHYETSLTAIPVSIAPLIVKRNNIGDSIGLKPCFWIKVEQLGLLPYIGDKNITWAKRLYRGILPQNIEPFKHLSSTTDLYITIAYCWKLKPESIPYLLYNTDLGWSKLKGRPDLTFIESEDAVLSLDSLTPNYLLLIQDWSWDESKNKLSIHNIGFAPLVDDSLWSVRKHRFYKKMFNSSSLLFKDSSTNFRNLMPLFVRQKRNQWLSFDPNDVSTYRSLKDAEKHPDRVLELKFESKNLLEFPETISEFKNLNILTLNNNQLDSLPESIGNLFKLTELYLNQNKLRTLPKSIGNLENLMILKLEANKLNALPDNFGRLSNLKLLYLGANQLKTLPKKFGLLKELSILKLTQNQFTKIPNCLKKLKKLTLLELSGNPLEGKDIKRWQKKLSNCKIVFRKY